MTRGRKPKPTHLKAVTGNPGRRPLPENEPQPKRARPDKPVGMGKFANKLWDVVSEEAFDMGVLTVADGPALRMLCEVWERFFQAQDALKRNEGMFYVSESVTGSGETEVVKTLIKVHPAVRIASDASKELRGWMSEFGLTPASRSKIEKAMDDGEEDEVEGFFSAKRA